MTLAQLLLAIANFLFRVSSAMRCKSLQEFVEPLGVLGLDEPQTVFSLPLPLFNRVMTVFRLLFSILVQCLDNIFTISPALHAKAN